MNILPCLPLLLGLMVASAPSTATANEAATRGLLPVPANRLVGLWLTDIYVSEEACSPGAPEPPLIGHNTLVFNAGGTLVENPRFPPIGFPGFPELRTFGIGTWSFNPRTNQYKVKVRFDYYATSNSAYTGYAVVDRTILLSNDRKTAYGPVRSTRYAPDDSVAWQVCGHAVSHRL